jgi:uncharacterized membrane protein/mono/diheme cytochrome c family protein
MNGHGKRALVAVAICSAWTSAAPATDLPTEVRGIFAAKCAACHGPDLPKPKGRFGYVLDLARVSGNREMVVPFVPDESELWELVRRGEMPPEDSPSGPLTAEQKETIRAWIAAGAPNGTGAASAEILPKPLDRSPEATHATFLKRMLGRLGPFHLLVVHFPIGLLIAAVLGEIWNARRGDRTLSPAVRFCVLVGSAGAVVAAALGWLHAWSGNGSAMPQTLTLHAWTGTLAAAWSVGTAFFVERDEHRQMRSQWFRAWLIGGAMLVAIASHFGGTLVHGENFLTGG